MIWIYLAIPTLFLISIFSFEYLVWHEFTYHRQKWIDDGRPPGAFWDGINPLSLSFFARSRARRRLCFKWGFWTPDWITKERYSRTALTIYRASTAAIPVLIFATIVYLYFDAYG